jgi:hypothetical protein
MRKLKSLAAVLLLTLLLGAAAPSAFAGEMGCPGFTGEISTPGFTGEMSTPGVAGPQESPGFAEVVAALVSVLP